MKKYFSIIKAAWQRNLTYRFTILSYRAGEIIEILILILMWSAIYGSAEVIKGYTLNEMITYLLIGNLVNVATRNFLTHKVARDIKDGRLSLYLIKPMKYFSYMCTAELGVTSLPFLMSLVTQIIVILFFLDKFIINFEIIHLLIIIIMIILAFILELLISFIVGTIAFWTDEVDGVHSTILRLRKLFSGGYFPLSLLPTFFVNLSFALPFAYSFFIPTQLYLNKIDISLAVKGIIIQIIWIFILYFIIQIIWKKGIKKFEGVGI